MIFYIKIIVADKKGVVNVSIVTFVDRQKIFRLFDIKNGELFDYWTSIGKHSHDNTKSIIFDACKIDIENDISYQGLNDQECIEKILDECNLTTILSFLENLVDYFELIMEPLYWCQETANELNDVKQIIERIDCVNSNHLPFCEDLDMELIKKDIEHNMKLGMTELVVDRLHTYSTTYLRKLCKSHNIEIKGNDNYPLDALVGKLNKFYKDENYYDNEFSEFVIKCSISIFNKFNSIRNNNSAAHPNKLLVKKDAELVVKMISSILEYIDKIENRDI